MTTNELKFTVSETFTSNEGEGPHTGKTTLYLRLAKCQFSCPKFNNPNNMVTEKGFAPLTFNPKDYHSLNDLPMITIGCDSQYAVNPDFSHLWSKLTTDELIDQLEELLPNNSWIYPNGSRVSFSLTGGEPTLQWKAIIQLLKHPRFKDCQHIIYETNAAAPLQWEFIAAIATWLLEDVNRKWTWSNSPKLSSSGEPWDKAIQPDIVNRQLAISGKGSNQIEQYFKFVAGSDEMDYHEIDKAMEAYHAAGIAKTAAVYVMPMSCTIEQQQDVVQFVANKCIQQGYILCYRVHSAVWGNVVGT